MVGLVVGLLTALNLGCSSKDDDGIMIGGPGASGGGGSGNGSGTGGAGGLMSGQGASGPIIIAGSGGGNGDGGGCASSNAKATPVLPLLQFLIDTSGSMNQPPHPTDPDGTPTKWVQTRDALIQSFNTMRDGTGVGIIYYPATGGGRGGGGGTCINKRVAVPLASLDGMVRTQIVDSLQDTNPNGATPTHDALVYAQETVLASTVPGDKYIVLITDGAPTYALMCTGDGKAEVPRAPLIQWATEAAAAGVKTFVIGAPGSESAAADLSQMAVQGQTPRPGCVATGPNYCHFDMTAATDLATALNEALAAITGSIVSCTFQVPDPPAGQTLDPNRVNVNFTNGQGMTTVIPRDPGVSSCTTTGTWAYQNNNSEITLCGDLCTQVQGDAAARVEIAFGCTTMVK